jgi:hypothetical protein
MKINDYYYATCATGSDYIEKYSQFAVRSLLRSGVNSSKIHVCVRTEEDRKKFSEFVPERVVCHEVAEDLSKVRWKYSAGLRRYSLFKIGALAKTFPVPVCDESLGKSLVYFDGDVLFFRDPTPFFDKVNNKTWFHHVKDYSFRASRDFGITERDVDVNSFDSLSRWVPPVMAHLLLKYTVSSRRLPKTHACAGLFVLHPKDHELILSKTYEYTKEIAGLSRFDNDSSVGDQKPMNAVLSIFNVDWHGGHKDQFADCQNYMNHYFGIDEMKQAYYKKVKELGLSL